MLLRHPHILLLRLKTSQNTSSKDLIFPYVIPFNTSSCEVFVETTCTDGISDTIKHHGVLQLYPAPPEVGAGPGEVEVVAPGAPHGPEGGGGGGEGGARARRGPACRRGEQAEGAPVIAGDRRPWGHLCSIGQYELSLK